MKTILFYKKLSVVSFKSEIFPAHSPCFPLYILKSVDKMAVLANSTILLETYLLHRD